jgi:cellulose synthase/poly-beta-1,6-N-acetylglucosamine synthase-like glycosyltransferase
MNDNINDSINIENINYSINNSINDIIKIKNMNDNINDSINIENINYSIKIKNMNDIINIENINYSINDTMNNINDSMNDINSINDSINDSILKTDNIIIKLNIIDENIILPTPPTDEEKYLYIDYKYRSLIYLITTLVSVSNLSSIILLIIILDNNYYLLIISLLYFLYNCIFYYIYIIKIGIFCDIEIHKIIINNITFFPKVDIFLPVCNEPLFIIENTWKYIKLLDYPNLNIYVLDDGCNKYVEQLALEYNFNYIVRDDRPLYKKAGNLRNAFKQTDGQFIVVFDADFCPNSKFLLETIPYMINDPSIGILQTPQYFRCLPNQTWVEQNAGIIQEIFYKISQNDKNIFFCPLCVGTNAIYRRFATFNFGGTAKVNDSEDVNTGLRVILQNYKIRYLAINLATGMNPYELQGFFFQQYRWCSGSINLLTSYFFWSSNINIIQKFCFFTGFLYYVTNASQIIIKIIFSIILLFYYSNRIIIFNFLFSIPLILNIFFIKYLSSQKYTCIPIRICLFQQYIYIITILDNLLDNIFHNKLQWVSTGAISNSTNKNSKYFSTILTMIICESSILLLTIVSSIIHSQNISLILRIYT